MVCYCLLIFLYPGFSTDGDNDNVRFVGPIAPATNFSLPGKQYSLDLNVI